MGGYPLRASTASQEVPLGPFLDDTDGKTAETALTIANTDIKLHKTGATTLANKNSGGATHISGGIYYAVFDATDTNTVGPMVAFISVSGALPIKVELEVLAANYYDARYGSDLLDVSVTQWTGTNVASPDTAGYPKVTLKSGTGTGEVSLSSGTVQQTPIRQATAQAGASGSITLDASASATDNLYNGLMVQILSGTGAGQVRTITAYVGSTKVASTHPNWTTNPDSSSVFAILPNASTNVATWRGSTPNQLQSGRVDGYVGAMAADTVTASAVASDAGTEIGTAVWATAARTLTANTNLNDLNAAGIRAAVGLASANLDTQLATLATASALSTLSGKVDTVDDFLDTEIGTLLSGVAAVKAVTDLLPNGGALTSLATAANLATVDTVVDGIALKVADLWALDGLDISNPMTVTPTSRVAGTIAQTISGDGTTTTTVTRTA